MLAEMVMDDINILWVIITIVGVESLEFDVCLLLALIILLMTMDYRIGWCLCIPKPWDDSSSAHHFLGIDHHSIGVHYPEIGICYRSFDVVHWELSDAPPIMICITSSLGDFTVHTSSLAQSRGLEVLWPPRSIMGYDYILLALSPWLWGLSRAEASPTSSLGGDLHRRNHLSYVLSPSWERISVA